MAKKQLTDWRGVPIYVGSFVIYPSRQGTRMWLTEGEVMSVDPEVTVKKVRSNKEGIDNPSGYRISKPSVARLTVIGE